MVKTKPWNRKKRKSFLKKEKKHTTMGSELNISENLNFFSQTKPTPSEIPVLKNLSSDNPGDRAWAATSISNLIQTPSYYQTLLQAQLIKKLTLALKDDHLEVVYEALGSILNIIQLDSSIVSSLIDNHVFTHLESLFEKLKTQWHSLNSTSSLNSTAENNLNTTSMDIDPQSQVESSSSFLDLPLSLRLLYQSSRVLTSITSTYPSSVSFITRSPHFIHVFLHFFHSSLISSYPLVCSAMLEWLEVLSEENPDLESMLPSFFSDLLLQFLAHPSPPCALSSCCILFNLQIETSKVNFIPTIVQSLHPWLSSLHLPSILESLSSNSTLSTTTSSSLTLNPDPPSTLSSSIPIDTKLHSLTSSSTLSKEHLRTMETTSSTPSLEYLTKGFELLINLISYILDAELNEQTSLFPSFSESVEYPAWFGQCLNLIQLCMSWIPMSLTCASSFSSPSPSPSSSILSFTALLMTVLNNFFFGWLTFTESSSGSSLSSSSTSLSFSCTSHPLLLQLGVSMEAMLNLCFQTLQVCIHWNSTTPTPSSSIMSLCSMTLGTLWGFLKLNPISTMDPSSNTPTTCLSVDFISNFIDVLISLSSSSLLTPPPPSSSSSTSTQEDAMYTPLNPELEKVIGILVCLGRFSPGFIHSNLKIGSFLLSLLPSSSSPSPSLLSSSLYLHMACLDAFMDIYNDGQSDYDINFRHHHWLLYFQSKVMPTLKQFHQHMNKKKNPTLKREYMKMLSLFQSFLEYKSKEVMNLV